MSRLPCDQLDDFLDELLVGNAQLAFKEHLRHCAECADAVQLQATIDSALRSYSDTLREPETEARASEERMYFPHFQRQVRLASLLLVAAGVCLVGWFPMSVWNQGKDSSLHNGSELSSNSNNRSLQNKTGGQENRGRKDQILTVPGTKRMRIDVRKQLSPDEGELAEIEGSRSPQSGLRVVRLVPGRTTTESGREVVKRSRIESVTSADHVAVASQPYSDGLTLVMLFPKVVLTPQGTQDAN